MIDPKAANDAYESLDMTIGEEADEGGWTPLPDGVYAATIEKYETERYEPGPNSSLPPCWKVTVTMSCDDGKGNSGTLSDNLYCTRRQSWKIKNLFVSCGLISRDVKEFTPDWKALPGRELIIEVSTRKYTKDGKERETNDVRAYMDLEDGQRAMNAADAQGQQPSQGGFSFPRGN